MYSFYKNYSFVMCPNESISLEQMALNSHRIPGNDCELPSNNRKVYLFFLLCQQSNCFIIFFLTYYTFTTWFIFTVRCSLCLKLT